MQGVAELVDHHGDEEAGDGGCDKGVVGEQVSDAMAELPEDAGGDDGHDHDEVKAGKGGTAQVGQVFLPLVISDPDGGGGAHAVVHHEEDGRDRQHDLMGGQRNGGNPADHDGGQGKGSGFHAHLQGEGPSHRVQLPVVGTVEMRTEKPFPVVAVAGQVKEDANEDRHHQKAREKG